MGDRCGLPSSAAQRCVVVVPQGQGPKSFEGRVDLKALKMLKKVFDAADITGGGRPICVGWGLQKAFELTPIVCGNCDVGSYLNTDPGLCFV